MDDNYIHFSIDGRDLKINKETPEDIFMWKTHGPGRQGKLKKPYWFKMKVQTNNEGYKLITITPKTYRLHRVNYYAHNQTWNIYNSCIKTNSIDHKKDKGDLPKHRYNNIENLRVVTCQQNQWNRNCKGYYFNKKVQKWQSRIGVNGKQIHLGLFLLEEEARNAYIEAKKIYHKIQ